MATASVSEWLIATRTAVASREGEEREEESSTIPLSPVRGLSRMAVLNGCRDHPRAAPRSTAPNRREYSGAWSAQRSVASRESLVVFAVSRLIGASKVK